MCWEEPSLTMSSPPAKVAGKDNGALVEDDFNEVDWQGARGAIRWLVNDAWTVTASANYQDVEADGFNDYDPNVGDLETVKFAEEKRTDEWYQTSLVIEGDLGFAHLVSATSYYDREVMYQHDTLSSAAYFHYSFGIYYGYALYDFGLDPTGYLINDRATNESFTQEIQAERRNRQNGLDVGRVLSGFGAVLGLLYVYR